MLRLQRCEYDAPLSIEMFLSTSMLKEQVVKRPSAFQNFIKLRQDRRNFLQTCREKSSLKRLYNRFSQVCCLGRPQGKV